MKKTLISLTYTGLLTTVLLSYSCKKLIQIPDNPPNQIQTSQVFTDSVNAVNGVVGIYAANFANFGPLNGSITQYTSLTADELTSTSTTYTPFVNNALFAVSASVPGGSVSDLWSGLYKSSMIYQANAAIEALNAAGNLSSGVKNQLIGECEVVRALAYFNLVNLFGSVPLATTSNTTVNASLPRATTEQVYVQIVTDLKDASSRLSDKYPSSGRARPNKATALALLSRAYLYQQLWKDSETAATSIISNGVYTLASDLNKVFVQGTTEAIWQIAAFGTYPYATAEGINFIPLSLTTVPKFYLTTALNNAFETGDNRKLAWLSFSTNGGTKYYYPFKYKNTYNVQTNGNTEGYVIFRLAEQYLIRAEARVQQGNLAGGIADLNVIRKRAGLPDTKFTAKDDLLTAILHERQIELFCESGQRWYDLKRSGKINAILGAEKPGIWPADGHAALYPVPNDQIQLNSNLNQNSGY